jgi:hypothetical protein
MEEVVKTKPGRLSTNELLTALDQQVVKVDGLKMSALEATLRLLYKRSLRGDVSASVDLQKIRDECRVEEPQTYGVLLVSEPMSEEDFELEAFNQQAQFREGNYSAEGL